VPEKRRYTVSLPEHIAEEIEKHSRLVGAKDAEYIAAVVRWWYGQGSPPTSDEEKRLGSERPSARRAS